MTPNPQTILLTGATGFLGSHLVNTWVQAGHHVAILKRRSSCLNRIENVLDRIRSFDIEDGINQPFEICSPFNAVVHTATCYGRAGETSLQVFETNTAFPLQLLEAASFFNADTFFNTDTILYKYLNAYALSKKHFAEWGQSYVNAGQIRFLNIRLEHMYGPGDDASKFTTYIIRSCISNVPELALTAGEQKRDFIYIDDVVSAYTRLLQRHFDMPKAFVDLGLGSGEAVRIRDFVELTHRLSGSRTELKFGALPYREGEIMESTADITALQQMGWQPRFTLEKAIQNTLSRETSQ